MHTFQNTIYTAQKAKEISTNHERESLFYLFQTKKHEELVEEIDEDIKQINEYIEIAMPSQIQEIKQTIKSFFGKEGIHIEKYFNNGDIRNIHKQKPIPHQETIKERYNMYQNIKEIMQEKEEHIEL